MTEDAEMFNQSLCIICQKDDKLPLTSELTGRNNVKRAAEIRNDAVTKRLRSIAWKDGNQVNDDKTFVYHNTNTCYKNYTHANKLKSIEAKNKQEDENPMECQASSSSAEFEMEPHSTRSSSTPRAPPSTQRDPKTLPCIICGQITNKKSYDKYRICEYESAVKLIEAATYNQDAVHTRIADLVRDTMNDSVKAVIAADLHCHPSCRRMYTVKYERDTDIPAEQKQPSPTSRVSCSLVPCPILIC